MDDNSKVDKSKIDDKATIDVVSPEFGAHNPYDDEHLHRGLKPRHISLLSIGGIIGTGLFLGER